MCFDEVAVILARNRPACQWCLMPNPLRCSGKIFVYSARRGPPPVCFPAGRWGKKKKQKPRGVAWRLVSSMTVQGFLPLAGGVLTIAVDQIVQVDAGEVVDHIRTRSFLFILLYVFSIARDAQKSS